MKKLILAAAMVAGTFANTSAFALPTCDSVLNPIFGFALPSDLQALGSSGCQQQDKIWSNFTFKLNGVDLTNANQNAVNAQIQGKLSVVSVPGADFHTADWQFGLNALKSGTNADINYTITVDPAVNTDPANQTFFAQVQNSMISNAAVTTVSMHVIPNIGSPFDLNLYKNSNSDPTLNKLSDLMDIYANKATSLQIALHLNTNATGVLNGLSQTFTENKSIIPGAPEIDAMAGTGALTLLAGALALAGERRRRRS